MTIDVVDNSEYRQTYEILDAITMPKRRDDMNELRNQEDA